MRLLRYAPGRRSLGWRILYTRPARNSKGVRPRSVDQLQGKLDLARVASRFANYSKAGAVEDIRRKSHGDDVEQVEELTAEL